jgi:hypothetical protein
MSNNNRSSRETPRSAKSLWTLFTAFVLAAGLLFTGCPGTTEPQSDPPAKPVITSITPASATSLTVNWATATDAHYYEVYAGTANTIPANAAKSNISTGSTTLTGLTSATVYNIWVKAVSSYGSTASDPWEAIPYDPGVMNDFVGAWDSGTGDDYIITENTLTYNGYYSSFSFAGNIKAVIPANQFKGVIIVEYTTPPTGVSNNFMGIYYQNFYPTDQTPNVQLANAYDASETTETATLSEALVKFTNGAVEDYVTWGLVVPQKKQVDTDINTGTLRGNWIELEEDNDYYAGAGYEYYIRITNNSFTACISYISTDSICFSGSIEDVTDTTQSSGYIYIKLTDVSAIYADAEEGDYWTIHWKGKTDNKVLFSIYNENDSVDSLNDAKNYTTDDFDDDNDYIPVERMVSYP